MLDKQILKLVKKLLKLCDGSNYKVFEYQQLTDTPSKTSALKSDIEYLKEHEYIDVKYSDESVVCLCLLPKARQIEEQVDVKKFGISQVVKILFISGLFSGVMAFLGAFVAVLIIK